MIRWILRRFRPKPEHRARRAYIETNYPGQLLVTIVARKGAKP